MPEDLKSDHDIHQYPSFFIKDGCEHGSENLEISLEYFGGQKPKCEVCNKEFDLWSSILKTLTDMPFKMITLSPIGAKITFIQFKIKPNEIFELNLAESGIPEDASILEVSFTSGPGRLFPLLFTGPVVWPRKRINHKLRLFPGPFVAGEGPLERRR
jgi:hypothetical protein